LSTPRPYELLPFFQFAVVLAFFSLSLFFNLFPRLLVPFSHPLSLYHHLLLLVSSSFRRRNQHTFLPLAIPAIHFPQFISRLKLLRPFYPCFRPLLRHSSLAVCPFLLRFIVHVPTLIFNRSKDQHGWSFRSSAAFIIPATIVICT
jgi:hypothetical protein